MAIDVAAIRAHFPALTRLHHGNPVAYFDGPGGTQVPRAVVESMSDYLYSHNANTHWNYPTSRETDEAIARARQALADFLNASPREIVFGANMTTITFHLARALGRGWKAGDEVIVTELDHHANVAPWQAIARDFGIRLRMVRMDPTSGQLDWDALKNAFSSRTRLLAIGAASNALGTITDVKAAAAVAHAAGALCFVDAVHYAPHMLVDVRHIECDFLACSAYKFYGPHVGVLFGRGELLAALDVPKLAPAPEEAPDRMETGTQNHEGIVGAAAAVDFLAALGRGDDRRARLLDGFSGLHAEGKRLLRRLWEGLGQDPRVCLYGVAPDTPRTPTIAFTVKGIPSGSVVTRLAERGIFASHGDFYAATVVERLGVGSEGLVRAGCACYTSEIEVDRLIEGITTMKSN
ncbi:MAG: cysteine desulfurase-like protein [Gemmatimonadota bacterium]